MMLKLLANPNLSQLFSLPQSSRRFPYKHLLARQSPFKTNLAKDQFSSLVDQVIINSNSSNNLSRTSTSLEVPKVAAEALGVAETEVVVAATEGAAEEAAEGQVEAGDKVEAIRVARTNQS